MCDVIPGYACFVCVIMRLRLDKKLFILPFYVVVYFVTDERFVFVLFFQYLAKRFAGKNVSKMTYFVSGGT